MSDPFTDIVDSHQLLRELQGAFLPVSGSSSLLSGLSPDDRADFLQSYLDRLDDLLVLSLFAVFESRLKDHAIKTLTEKSSAPRGMREWLEGAVEYAKVAQLIGAFGGTLAPHHASRLSNIRKFRNWVAHDHAGPMPASVSRESPLGAYSVLLHVLRSVGAV